MAGLRLDQRDAAIAKGAIAPGDPTKSSLIVRVFAAESDTRMPPDSAHKELTAAQKAILRRWVAEGAVYEPHWAYVVPTRPAVPKVRNTAWVRNPVDNFILARLESEKLTPSPQADKRTLLRRVSLDLTGLPPTPQEVRAFLADTWPDAYERVVDRLLASPAYGERMGGAVAGYGPLCGYGWFPRRPKYECLGVPGLCDRLFQRQQTIRPVYARTVSR